MKLLKILKEHVLDKEIADLEYQITRIKHKIKNSDKILKNKLRNEKNELQKKLNTLNNKKTKDLYDPKTIENILKSNHINKSGSSKSYVVQGYSEITAGYSLEKLGQFGEIILYKISASEKLLQDFKDSGYTIKKIFSNIGTTYITIEKKENNA